VHGASGAEFTSGNPRLTKYVLEQGKAAGIPVPALKAFAQAMQKASGADVMTSAEAAERFVSRNEARVATELAAENRPITTPPQSSQSVPAPESVEARANGPKLQGYVMEQEQRNSRQPRSPARPASPVSSEVSAVLVTVPALVVLLAWRRRHRRVR